MYKIIFALALFAIPASNILLPQSIHAQSAQQAKAYYFLAVTAYDEAKYDMAYSHLKKAEELRNSTDEVFLALEVKILTKQKKFLLAKDKIDQFYSLRPSNALQQEVAPFLLEIDSNVAVAREKNIKKSLLTRQISSATLKAINSKGRLRSLGSGSGGSESFKVVVKEERLFRVSKPIGRIFKISSTGFVQELGQWDFDKMLNVSSVGGDGRSGRDGSDGVRRTNGCRGAYFNVSQGGNGANGGNGASGGRGGNINLTFIGSAEFLRQIEGRYNVTTSGGKGGRGGRGGKGGSGALCLKEYSTGYWKSVTHNRTYYTGNVTGKRYRVTGQDGQNGYSGSNGSRGRVNVQKLGPEAFMPLVGDPLRRQLTKTN